MASSSSCLDTAVAAVASGPPGVFFPGPLAPGPFALPPGAPIAPFPLPGNASASGQNGVFNSITMTGGRFVLQTGGDRTGNRGGRRDRRADRRRGPSKEDKEVLRKLKKLRPEQFTDVDLLFKTVRSLQEAQERARQEAQEREARISALVERSRQLEANPQLATPMDVESAYKHRGD